MAARKLRSGKSYVKFGDIRPFQIGEDIAIEPLVDRALQEELTADFEEPEEFQDAPLPLPVQPNGIKRPLPSDIQPQTPCRSRKRARQRQNAYERQGHLASYGASVGMKDVEPLDAQFKSETLPVAQGGYVAAEQSIHGRTADRSLAWFKENGFQVVEFDGSASIPIVDSKGRVLAVAAKKIDTPQYNQDTADAANAIDEAREAACFKPSEQKGKRGSNFAALAYGNSYGKGQPRPMRLGGPRMGLMENLLNRPCFAHIAHHQSSAYVTFSPKNYKYYFEGNRKLYAKLPDLHSNFPKSEFACITNTAHGMCAVTALGSFNPKLGGHLVLWDLKLLIEFPPGCTILLPSALLRHSNTSVQAHETRYSVTQYTAGGIWRWLDSGGQTKVNLKLNNPEEWQELQTRKQGRRERVLDMFSTLEEIKAALVA
ncbi:hypothetical protein K435DRAFT_876959 [Dendrothele bispora CBS 962.96]|uniref:Uncharacterized protein n=1 Tax=Dendrothele bispora (strain CBS 962.96) TaxID=1314807 RepID=A0A4S8KQX6_DENBC|nr:hypothetical protein K435DRAFT_876959 [Dendrothele bispora CBS 962.96]